MDAAEANATARNMVHAWRQAKIREGATAEAADGRWPYADESNAGIRRGFCLSADKQFVGIGKAEMHRELPKLGTDPFALTRFRFRVVIVLAAFGVLVVGQTIMDSAQPGPNDEFLAYVNPKSSKGAIAVRSAQYLPDTRAPSWVTVYSWDFDQFLAETGFSDLESPLKLTNTAFAAGRWNGTNWSYRAGDLVIVSRVSRTSDLAELLDALGGKMPEEATFEAILGRGLYLEDFARLQVNGNTVRGFYHQRIPFRGVLDRGPEHLEYAYRYRLDGTETSRSHHVKLQPFPSGGHLPSRLTTWVGDGGAMNIESDYEILAVSATPARRSLSPFQLYPEARLLEQADDKLFQRRHGVRLEIKRKPVEVTRRPKRVFIALFVGVTLLVVLVGFFLRSRGAKEKTGN